MLRAIAIATETSDVVGTVELGCEPDGLALAFVRASGYAVAHAPTPAARSRRIVVPWEHVKELADDGEALRIHLDSPVVPHHRLILTHLTRDQGLTHESVARRRGLKETGVAAGAAVAVGALTLAGSALGPVTTALFAGLTTFSAVTAAVLVGQGVARRALLGGDAAANERRLFVARARSFLHGELVAADVALSPPVVAVARPAPPAPRDAPSNGLPPWPVFAVGAAAAIGLAALAALRGVSGPGPAAPAPAGIAEAPRAPEPTIVEEPLDTCTCQTPWSPAIPRRVPQVSLLTSVVRRTGDARRPSMLVEVAAVNNGQAPLRDVTGAVTFLAPGPRADEPPRVTRDRGVFYPGPLAPGAAVKWRVGARGSSYRVAVLGADTPLADDAVASGDAFEKLLGAHTRTVRVHGAMMLARTRDPRAARAIERLREDAREDEAPTLDALGRAIAPVFACDLEIRGKASTCVMNTSDEAVRPRPTLVVRVGNERAIAARVALAGPTTLPPKTGARYAAAEAVEAAAIDGASSEVLLDGGAP